LIAGAFPATLSASHAHARRRDVHSAGRD